MSKLEMYQKINNWKKINVQRINPGGYNLMGMSRKSGQSLWCGSGDKARQLCATLSNDVFIIKITFSLDFCRDSHSLDHLLLKKIFKASSLWS